MSETVPGGTPSRGFAKVDAAQFEALFLNALKSPPELLERFRSFGFDARRMEAVYPMEVFVRCVQEATRHFHPELSPEEGSWRMGRAFLRGYFSTVVGKVIRAGTTFLSPGQILRRMPQFMQAGAARIPVTVTEEGSRMWRLDFRTVPEVVPEYMAGLIEESVSRPGFAPKVTLTRGAPGEFSVHVSW